MNEQGMKDYRASGREADRKNRIHRLIQLGALAEKYLHCEGASPEGFEEKVKQLLATQGRERAMGRWDKCRGEILNYACSKCGFQIGEPWDDPNELGRLAYCPHCGCEMPAAGRKREELNE